MPMSPGAPAAPQGAPAGQAPAPQGAPQSGGGAGQIVSQIHDGIQKLKPLVGGADPHLKQAFMGLDSAFQAFIAEASKPAGAQPGAQAPQAPAPKGPPMPSHAGPNAQPMPPGQ